MTNPVFSIYIVRCANGSLYTGIATDVPGRIAEHEAGVRGAKYLRGKGPLRLEFVQPIGDRGTASRLEYRVKRLSKARKEALLAGEISLRDLVPHQVSESGCA